MPQQGGTIQDRGLQLGDVGVASPGGVPQGGKVA